MNLTDDDFTLFGLPRRHTLDARALEERWRELQSQVHPDRHAAEGGAAQRVAMQWSVRVNEAYHRLRDPLQRAAYLCELHGMPVQAESNTRMPPAFLLQQMQWREALEEARDAAELERLEDEVRAQSRAMTERLAAWLDAPNPPESDLQAAAAEVRALMFVHRFLQDLARRAEAFEQG